MKAQDKLEKALTTITLNSSLAFWAGLALQVPKVITTEVPTAATDGERILFNPNFIKPLPNEQVVFLILHELLHIIRMDTVRVGERDRHTWSIAADAVINDMLRDMSRGMGVPIECIKGGVYPDGEYAPMKGQASEWNYRWLMENQPQQKENPAQGGVGSPKECGSGENQTDNQSMSPHDEILPNKAASDNPKAHENKIKRMVQSAVQMAREQGSDPMAGDAPAWLRELIAEITRPKVNWREQLRDFMGSLARQDWTWRRPHTTILLFTGCVAPTIQAQPGIPHVAVLLDSSGSVSDRALAQAWGEIRAMADIIEKLSVCHFTVGIDEIEEYDMRVDAPDSIAPTSRFDGGTSIVSAMDQLLKMTEQGGIEQPDVIIVLSDMYADIPQDDPGIPTIWAVLDGSPSFKAPYGVQINVTEE